MVVTTDRAQRVSEDVIHLQTTLTNYTYKSGIIVTVNCAD